MSRRMRIYYYAVFGAVGGLLGWQITNLMGLSFSGSIYFSDAITGLVLGFSLGFPIGAAEGLLSLNPLRALRSGLISGMLAGVAGAIGLPLGEMIFQVAGAASLGRAIGWGVLGLSIGLAEGIVSGTEIWKGGLGGLIGGLFGGALLEISRLFGGELAAGKMVGLTLLGASIGTFIALIVVLLSRAWLKVRSGKLKGVELILDKYLPEQGSPAIIGSNPLKSEITIPDEGISPQHAILKGFGSHFTIKDISMSGTYLSDRKIEHSQIYEGQSIRLGKTALTYHERR